MLRKILSSAIVMAATSSVSAQDSTETTASKPVISGYADVFYRYSLNNPKKDAGTFNNYTSFSNSHNSFELGMASVKVEHAFGKVGMVADIGFGKRAEEFSYNDENTRFAIKQLNLSYSPWENVKFTAGSWATHVGYELVDAYANRNYSMSYMFSKGPFFHTGIKTDFTVGRSGFMIGITNPTDLKSASFSNKFIVAQYSIVSKNELTKAYINFQSGKPDFAHKVRQVDMVVTNAFSDKFSIGYNGTIASAQSKSNGKFEAAKSWWGSALYFNADPVSWMGLTLRTEYFKDEKILTDVFAAQAEGGHVFETTLSANFKINNLTIIPELRLDNASQEIFTKHSGATTKTATTALLAAVYKF
jgi:hypothetical protein